MSEFSWIEGTQLVSIGESETSKMGSSVCDKRSALLPS